MNVWWILAIIFVIASIIFAIFAKREKGIVLAVCTFLSIIITVMTMIIAVVFPLSAKQDIIMFEAIKSTIAITGPVIDDDVEKEMIEKANNWLEYANDDLDKFGIFSKYYKSGINKLEPIEVTDEKWYANCKY